MATSTDASFSTTWTLGFLKIETNEHRCQQSTKGEKWRPVLWMVYPNNL